MVKETLKSKEGRAKEKFHMQLYYGKEMYEAWTDGSALQNAIAPLFKARDEDADHLVRDDGRREPHQRWRRGRGIPRGRGVLVDERVRGVVHLRQFEIQFGFLSTASTTLLISGLGHRAGLCRAGAHHLMRRTRTLEGC